MNSVHIEEVILMNTVVTSREAILSQSRKIVMDQGLSAINMRTVAAACGVAVGSIYNYFPSKTELINAAVEDVWRDIFHVSGDCFKTAHFTDCLSWIFESFQEGCKKYPGFFTLHSMSYAQKDKKKGRQMMEQYFAHIKNGLLIILKKDADVRENVFNDVFTPEEFVDLIFSLVTSMLLQGKSNCGTLVEMTSRCIY